ncbi:hypothetical protein AGMMS50276_22110 [Synergistales bacterium]|nr:hypothetical protein AGMMS50276_22110 [Synergistales bacterium]
MGNQIIGNVEVGVAVSLEDLVSYESGQIKKKVLLENSASELVVFAFDKDQGFDLHTSAGDAFITILDGKVRVTIEKDSQILEKGQSILMPADIPHAVFAVEPFKMFLVVEYRPKI